MPAQGFYVIVPPEYRRLGCLPGEQFVPQLMEHRGLAYYVGLLSAAQYHGAAHHKPQVFQVLVEKNQRPIACGAVKVAFIKRRAIAHVPTTTRNTPRGVLRLSTAEATAVDLMGYPEHAGSLDQVATVLSELAEQIDPAKLVLAAQAAPLAWAQRLGYLLELVGSADRTELLAAYVRDQRVAVTPLSPSEKTNPSKRNHRWRLDINVQVEAET